MFMVSGGLPGGLSWSPTTSPQTVDLETAKWVDGQCVVSREQQLLLTAAVVPGKQQIEILDHAAAACREKVLWGYRRLAVPSSAVCIKGMLGLCSIRLPATRA